MVIVGAVAVVLAVGLVVLVVVGDEVIEVESIVRGNEIDTGPGPAAALIEDVAGSGDAPREFCHGALVALPERAHGIAEFVVPFRPAGRKVGNLVAAGTDIPRLG